MLSTTDGKCLRFPVKSLRLFSGLNSGGVKGIKLEKNNFVVSLSILQHSRIDMNIRREYLKSSSENRKNGSGFINNNDFEELQKKKNLFYLLHQMDLEKDLQLMNIVFQVEEVKV